MKESNAVKNITVAPGEEVYEQFERGPATDSLPSVPANLARILPATAKKGNAFMALPNSPVSSCLSFIWRNRENSQRKS
jgi:hypothetical protein